MDSEALDRMTMALVGVSPTDEAQMGLLDTQPVIQILPDANVIKIGGQSFIDRGRAAVFPLIEEIVENLPHRTDAGCYLISEVLGARSMIYVKDEDGLYTADPKKDRNAKFIPKITVEELERLDLVDVVLEHTVFQLMRNAKNRRSVQVINGLKRGNLTRALNGEPVGTIITA